MREDTPSLTAALVSFCRGVGVRGDAPDPYARLLCPKPFGPLLDALEGAGPFRPALRGVYRVASLGLVDHMVLRTSAIDRGLGGCLAAGVRQLVLLGAGLDSRALRVHGLEGIRVFEVDHPATQAFKRRRVAGRLPDEPQIAFVPVDFARDSLEERLPAAGFDAGAPTAWIWEGVAMYLPREAALASLETIASLSAKGSRLLMTYMTPDAVPGGPVAGWAVRAAFEAAGEGLRVAFEPSELDAVLSARGLQLRSDTSAADWARDASSARHAWSTRLFRGERLAIAEKR